MLVVRVIILFLLLGSLTAKADELADLYQSYGVQGVLLIQSLDAKTEYVHNPALLNTEFSPASTFKIPNTLIALQEGVVTTSDEIIEWNQVKRDYGPWNHDQTLKSAFAVSCVWCYQRFSRIVGDQKYQQYLQSFGYGNKIVGPDIATFWLDGSLKISVRQQVDFLRRLYDKKLSINPQHYNTLQQIMLSDNTDVYTVWSKTGWARESGWYVGYIETFNNTWFFANHINIRSQDDLKLRKKITFDALQLLSIIERETDKVTSK